MARWPKYYGRALKWALKDTTRFCTAHWGLSAFAGPVGVLIVLAVRRFYRGDGLVVEGWSDLLAAAVGMVLVCLITFLYKLAEAPVELDATLTAKISNLESRIAELELAIDDPPVSRIQQQRRDDVQAAFGDCSSEVEEVLSRLTTGTLAQDYIRGGSSQTLPGATEFYTAFQERGNKVIDLRPEQPGTSAVYKLRSGYNEAMEWFLNERLG